MVAGRCPEAGRTSASPPARRRSERRARRRESRCDPGKLIALYERERRGHPRHPEFSYKVFFACEVCGAAEPRPGPRRSTPASLTASRCPRCRWPGSPRRRSSSPSPTGIPRSCRRRSTEPVQPVDLVLDLLGVDTEYGQGPGGAAVVVAQQRLKQVQRGQRPVRPASGVSARSSTRRASGEITADGRRRPPAAGAAAASWPPSSPVAALAVSPACAATSSSSRRSAAPPRAPAPG